MNKYPGGMIGKIDFNNNLDLSPYIVNEVLTAFNKISLFGQVNHIDLANTFEDAEATIYNIEVGNHFQGVTRHRNGRYFYFSGNDLKQGAHLFIVKMGTYRHKTTDKKYIKKAIRSNLINDHEPGHKDLRKQNDVIVDLFIIDKKLTHAGGISMMGDVLVAPLEGEKGDGSKICFIDVSNPEKPDLIKKIHIKSSGKAGSASAIQLANGHILCASWTESGGHRFSFYLTKQPGLTKFSKSVDVRIDMIENAGIDPKLRFQDIQFVQDTSGDIFLIGMDSEKKTGGKSRWHLMRIHLDPATTGKNPTLRTPKIILISTKWPHKGYTYYNFNSCGGAYVDDSKRLTIYAGSKSRGGRKGQTLKLTEFYPKLVSSDGPCTDINDAVIELFTEPLFGGRSLVIQVGRHDPIPNYHKIEVAGPTIDDKFRSLSYMLPKGAKYWLYQDDNYNIGKNGKIKKNRKILKLTGTGDVQFIPDLSIHPTAKNIKISSSKLK